MFISNKIYKRSDIHDQYGGSRQHGISSSAQQPYIFIFSGSQGSQHGYKDQWMNDTVYSYTGEGQVGDMKFTKGNLALMEHRNQGKRVFLFEYVNRGYVRFESELEINDADFFETSDRNGDLRIGIKFFFNRIGARPLIRPEQMQLDFAADTPRDKYEIILPNSTEREGLVTSRVGQGAYRKGIIHRWNYQCAVTQFSDPKILIASHIVPWKDASDEQRLDVDNGILLSPTYDALFDRHLISFENSGKILLSDQITWEDYKKIGVTGKEVINSLSLGNKKYLEKHNENHFNKH
ncbi:HNH endonuclease [uncultured Algoriphagus sp.]|uniref:HNH endonuclease n=1 Tax=uncultured Algoriphagus sp. TaxID=417365 RepID=UPI0030EF61A8|tara:strand:- start:5271 stop:6149 length:879 start_codon:yes stop_codon:yes gene_type:complete